MWLWSLHVSLKSLKLKLPFSTSSSCCLQTRGHKNEKTRRTASVFVPVYVWLAYEEKRLEEQKERGYGLPLACVMLGALSC